MGWGGLNSILVFFGPGDFIIFYENQKILLSFMVKLAKLK